MEALYFEILKFIDLRSLMIHTSNFLQNNFQERKENDKHFYML